MTLMGTPENNMPSWMNDLIDRLPDGNVYTGGKGKVVPKIRRQQYMYEEVPTPSGKTQTGTTLLITHSHDRIDAGTP